MIKRISSTLRPINWELAAALTSGLFGALIFHHTPLGVLAWVALVPLFWAMSRVRGWQLFWVISLFGVVWNYLSLWWLNTLVVFHPVIPLGVITLALFETLYFIIFAYPASLMLRRAPKAIALVMVPLLWTAMEHLKYYLDVAFPWNFIGNSQVYDGNSLPMLSSVGGPSLISALLVFGNMLIFNLAVPEKGRRRPWVSTTAALVFIVGCWAWSWNARLDATTRFNGSSQPLDNLPIRVIQPSISQLDKWNALVGVPGETQQQAEARYRATEAAMAQSINRLVREESRNPMLPRLHILPEGAFLTSNFPYEVGLHGELQQLARDVNADLFFGADNRMEPSLYSALQKGRFDLEENGALPDPTPHPSLPVRKNDDGTTAPDFESIFSQPLFVSAWQVTPDQGLTGRVYNKIQLVPFGEMVPFVSGITWLQNMLESTGIAGAFRPGFQPVVFETGGIRYGTVICFESIFPHLAGNLARAGARFICVITNDAWYDPTYAIEQGGFWGSLFKVPGLKALASAGPRQHFIHSILRSIESGRPLVRSANNGISAIIYPDGRVQESRAYGTEGYIDARLLTEKKPQVSQLARNPYWFSGTCACIFAGVWLAGLYRFWSFRRRMRR